MEDSENVENAAGQESSISKAEELQIVTSIISQLSHVDANTRERILDTVYTFFGVRPTATSRRASDVIGTAGDAPSSSFSQDRSISPKQFLFEKQPNTDVERVACLAYYLTHYRDTPYFKTLDISKLNTESAQMKFANAANAVENAVKRNYLAPGTKGTKQLSALGEQFVLALPDRIKARATMTVARPKKKMRKPEAEAQ